MSDNPMITIDMVEYGAIVSAEFSPLITPLLELPRQRFIPGGPHGHQQIETRTNYWKISSGSLYFHAGHAQCVQRHLESLGYRVQIQDRTHWEHLATANTGLLAVEPHNPAQHDALLALSQNPRGQLRVAGSEELPHAIALIGRLFSSSSILVVARNRSLANWLAAEAGRLCDRPIDRNFDVAKHRRPRFLIETAQRLTTVGGDDFDILVCADHESALLDANDPQPQLVSRGKPLHASPLLLRLRNTAFYMVSDRHRQLSAAEEFRIEALFGPVIFSVVDTAPRHDIAFTFLSFNGQRPGEGTSPLDRKRRRFWHNPDWNSRVAEVAQQVAAGALSVLPPAEMALLSHPWISILVESPEHAAELQRRLPGWTLRSLGSPTGPPRVLEPRVRQIVTQQFAAQHGFGSDIVIRADGGAGWPLSGILEKAPETLCSRVLVDLDDRRDRECLALTESRRRAYAAAGWWPREIGDDSTGMMAQHCGT